MKTLLVLLLLAAPVAAERSPIDEALFETSNNGFQPPQHNKKLQALLAKKPKLTFFEACGVGAAAEVVRQLAADPKLATSWNDFGWSALHLAAFSGSVETVKAILDRGGDVHARARTKFKNTPLQTALLAGQLATAKLLLERGADPLVRQALGFAPIHEAAFSGRRDLVDLLLAHGAELDARANDGRTALTEARRRGHKDLAAYLVTKGAHAAEITADLAAPPRE
jgi:ankyrin repeat protein